MSLNMKGNNGYTQELIKSGSDAFTNLFYLKFKGGWVGAIDTMLKVRNQDFKAPTFTHPINNYNFMTTDVDMPKAEMTGDKKLTFNFRVDENYLVYKYLLKQRSVTSNPNLGFVNVEVPDSNHGGFDIQVFVYSGSGDIGDPSNESSFKKLYEFRNCWIMGVKGLTYGYDSSNPEKVSVDVAFMDFDDPDTLISKF